MKNWYIYAVLVAALILVLVLVRGNSTSSQIKKVSKFDDFAQCLTDAGAVFYGAFWCPHCQTQKKMLENSTKIPYIECSLPNRQMTQECAEKEITGFPTWEFSDGSRLNGEVQLDVLAEKTNCVLPE